jgi:ubiquinone/menaquinone biosynthesis C-methylase UbiE
MTPSVIIQPQAGLAFNIMAAEYDDHFTRSLIGRAQRNAIWAVALETFHRGDHILELNCGTGEDALFLSRNGISVDACDASEQMIRVARNRHCAEAPNASLQFHLLPTERLLDLQPTRLFDGAFSNFSGLNCVADLKRTSEDLSQLVKPGSPLLVCMSTRFCISEILWYLAHADLRKAFRRCSGHATARVGEFSIDVYYPTVRRLRKLFSPNFVLRSCTGIGVSVPPSYVEDSIRSYPRLLARLRSLDKVISVLPGLRVIGDHVLIHFERVQSPLFQHRTTKVQK